MSPSDTTDEDEDEDEVERSRMTLGEHLDELRRRLIYSAVALAVVFVVAWAYRLEVAEIALSPYEDKARPMLNARLFEVKKEQLWADGEPTQVELELVFYDGVVDEQKMIDPIRSARVDDGSSTFFFYLKVCSYAAFMVGGPFVLWQVWAFIAAGLYANEKRSVYRYFPASVVLFFAGVFFGYTYLVPYAYYFLSEMGLEQLRHEAFITPYLKFLTSLGIGMGVVFQLPILMMALSRVGLVDPRDFAKYRGHFIVVAAVLAALITPPDPYTQLMMAVPMAALYQIGIWLSKLFAPKDEDSPGDGGVSDTESETS